MTTESYENAMMAAGEARLSAAVEEQEYSLVKTLGLVPFKDGNMWCVLWGKNVQEGICGFGSSPWRAVISFNKAMHCEGE